MKLKFISPMLFPVLLLSVGARAQNTGDYRSVASGPWSAAATWEKYDGTTWNTPTNPPGSATPSVTVRSGHVVSLTATSSSVTLTVENGATIKSDGAGQRGLRVYGASLTNNGTIGGAPADDSINLEIAGSNITTTLSGTGTIKINRVRALQGVTGTTFVVDQDMELNNNGVGFTAYYNNTSSTAAENVTFTINAGRTVKLEGNAALHQNSSLTANTGGTYTYNINGTLDMSASKDTSMLIPNSVNASGVVTLNVAGRLITGLKGFSTQNAAPGSSPGTVKLNIAAGGVVDASLDSVMILGTQTFVAASGTAKYRKIVAAVDTVFPVSASAGGYNAVTLNNSGAADTFSVGVKAGFDDTWPAPAKLVNRQWNITESVAGGSASTVKLAWLTADQGASFTPGSVSIYHYNGTSWVETSATVTGSGTIASPYVATVSGIDTFVRFVVGNQGLQTPTGGSSVANIKGKDAYVIVAPNPVQGHTVQLQMGNLKVGSYEIAVYNVTGQKLAGGTISYNGGDAVAPVILPADIPAGLYELQLNNADIRVMRKLIIQ
ncbi:T9SS type A sorting domain-containing protein [Chitinophagaceae bacterium MMS25-I14]